MVRAAVSLPRVIQLNEDTWLETWTPLRGHLLKVRRITALSRDYGIEC